MFYFLSSRSLLSLKLSNMKLKINPILEIIKLGTPTFFIQVTNSIQQLILNRSLAKHGGDHALAAIGVIMNITSFLIMPAMGIGQGAQPILGYNKGAKEEERVRQTLIYALIFATGVVFLGFLVVKLWPEQIFALFTNEKDLLDTGVYAMNIFFKFIPLVGIQMIASNYFQAVGKPNQAITLGLSRQVLLFIPILLVLPYFYGLDGVWWSAPISDIAAFIFTGLWLMFEMKNFKKEEHLKEELKQVEK